MIIMQSMLSASSMSATISTLHHVLYLQYPSSIDARCSFIVAQKSCLPSTLDPYVVWFLSATASLDPYQLEICEREALPLGHIQNGWCQSATQQWYVVLVGAMLMSAARSRPRSHTRMRVAWIRSIAMQQRCNVAANVVSVVPTVVRRPTSLW